jgi:hypothetical protein
MLTAYARSIALGILLTFVTFIVGWALLGTFLGFVLTLFVGTITHAPLDWMIVTIGLYGGIGTGAFAAVGKLIDGWDKFKAHMTVYERRY